MCVAIPGVILSIDSDGSALVDFGGARRTVSVALLEEAKQGDYVVVHAGFALRKVAEEDAGETLALFRELLDENVR